MAFLVQRSDVGEFRRRYRWMVLFVLATFVVLIGRLVQLQVIEGDAHRAESRRNIIRQTTLATSRGVIRDAHGKVLEANRPSYNVYVVPGIINLETTWPRVATSCEYFSPVRFDDELELALTIVKVGNKSVSYEVEFRCDGRRIALGRMTTVYCTIVSGEFLPSPIPESVRCKIVEQRSESHRTRPQGTLD